MVAVGRGGRGRVVSGRRWGTLGRGRGILGRGRGVLDGDARARVVEMVSRSFRVAPPSSSSLSSVYQPVARLIIDSDKLNSGDLPWSWSPSSRLS